MMTDDVEITMSPLCQSYTEGDITVSIEIYSGNNQDWILEIVDENRTSIIWENTFSSDDAALEEFHRTLKEEGLKGIVEDDE